MSEQMDFSQVYLKEALFLDAVIQRDPNGNNGEVSGFSSQVSVSPSYSIEDNTIQIDVHITCQSVNEVAQPTGISGLFNMRFVFSAGNMQDHLLTASAGAESIPSPALMVPLIGAAYSTARGMIIVKALGTSLEGVTLPIVNVQDLIKPAPEPSKEKKKSTRKPAQPAG